LHDIDQHIFRAELHTVVLTVHEPDETVAVALEALSATEKLVVAAHFLDGDPVGRICRTFNLKRAEVEALIGTALTKMKTLLQSRGVRSVTDVI
jgi:DNA-directed RNA polymerase specialized sigma24 family protein